jgi:hypothetical protein
VHADRQLDFAAGRRRALSDQFRLDPPRLRKRRRDEQREKEEQATKLGCLLPSS